MPFELNDTTIGAIVGGAIAGLVSLGAQWLVILDNLKRTKDAEEARQRALAHNILIKLHNFVDHIHKWRNYYCTSDRRHQVFIDGEPKLWKPVFGSREVFDLTTEEQALLLDTNKADLYNSTADLQRLSQNLHMIHERYAEKFYAFQEQSKNLGTARISGSQISSEAPPDPIGIFELVDMLQHIRRALRDGVPISRKALDGIRRLQSEKYGRNIQMDFEEDISGVVPND